MIMTVKGPIAKEDLGTTLPHEHLLIDLKVFTEPPEDKKSIFYEKLSLRNLRYVKRDPYLIQDNALMTDVQTAIQEMVQYKAEGGRSLVDVTLREIGRDPKALYKISEESDVNIIMGCGYYVAAAHPKGIAAYTEQELAAQIVRDIEEGVDGTGIRAGVIGEIGTSATVTPEEWKCVRASGRAHMETGKAIHIHTSLYERNGTDIAKKLIDMGVRPEKIAIDHIDVDLREDYIASLLDLGVYVEFDNFGKEFYISKREGNALNGRFAYDLERATTVARFVEKGYVKQILLTNDICIKNMLCSYGGFGYGHILTDIKPMLSDCGVSDRDIAQMIEKNPADFLD